MTLAELRTALRAAVSGAAGGVDGAHDLAHADRVWAHTRTIAHGEGFAPTRVLLCAAYLHDLVNLPKDHPKRSRAAMMSATAAGPIMEAFGLSPTEIAQARHAIESHSWSAGLVPQSPEGRILRDADRLEALGAVGIARCFSVSGALERRMFHPDDPFAVSRPLDEGAYALDHFATKLLQLPDTFLTPTGRKLAEDRAAVMRRFLEELARELGRPAPSW